MSVILLSTASATATGHSVATEDRLRIEALSADATWRKLIHYEPGGEAQKKVVSAVLSPEFFLAEAGKSDPLSELRATIAAMAAPVGRDPNQHGQCRFPARYLWLKKMSVLAGVAHVNCPLFEQWIFGDATDSISIIFATGYLGNPASYYGHTLLKFNSSTARQKTDLLDVSINYGAIIPDGVGPISYMFNGATGGYSAGFSDIEYYFHDHNYGELELRDLWEYELKLSADEVRFVVAHSWEVLGKEFTYYFFRRNCAYRMAEVIELVDGIEIIPPQRPWTIPQVLVRRAADSKRDSVPLITDVKYHPSRQSLFYEDFLQLDREEREVLRKIARNPLSPDPGELMGELTAESKQEVIDTLINYYRYVIGADEPEDSVTSTQYRKMLALRFRLPPATSSNKDMERGGPENGRAPSYLSFGAFHNEILGNGMSIRVRPAYYDVLDSSVGHVPNSALAMLEMSLYVSDDGLFLRKLDIFYVEAVNGAVSGLPKDNGQAWVLAAGLQQQNLACGDCLVFRARADIGRSLAFGKHIVAGVYVGGALQDNRNRQGNAFVRTTAFVNLAESDRFRMRAQYENRYHFDSLLDMEEVFSVEGRFVLSEHWDARLRLEKNIASEAVLSLGYYW